VLFEGAGLTLAPGETRVFDFTEVVPEVAGVYGYAVLSCAFEVGRVYAGATEDRAAVPGMVGTLVGALRQPSGAAVPGVPVLLVDDTGRVAARTTSGADGTFGFVDVPANRYEVRLVGPWRFATEVVAYRQVYGGRIEEAGFEVVPGPAVADPEAPAATPATPARPAVVPRPQAAPRPANLADTGASVGELSALALLLLVGGGVLVFAGRRNCVR
jgi:hypothetical protein